MKAPCIHSLVTIFLLFTYIDQAVSHTTKQFELKRPKIKEPIKDHHHEDDFDDHDDIPEEDDPNKPAKCYGLALADATDFGPYQAGAIIGLMNSLPQDEMPYSTISGVSLGAINAHILSQYEPKQVDEASEALRSFWQELALIEPYQLWKGGFIYGFFFEKGLYDPTPLNNYLTTKFKNKDIKRHLTISVANVLNGNFQTFNEHHTNDEILEILKASVTYSGIAPAVELMGQLFFSGSAIYENDVMSAINHCEALGYKEEDIVIDSIVGGSPYLDEFDGASSNTWSVLRRTGEVIKFYEVVHGVLRAKSGHTGVNFRYVVGPTFSMPSKIVPIKFSPTETKSLMDHGERDAKNQVHMMKIDKEAQIQKRIEGPQSLVYYNKDRQAKHEQKMRQAFDL